MATITTIESTDTIGASRTTINDNFSALNADKIEAPNSSTDNAIVRFDGAAGATAQNSVVTVDDVGVVAGVTSLTVDNILIDGATISTNTTDTDLTLTPNGTGKVTSAAPAIVKSGSSASAGGAVAITVGTGASGVVGIYFGSGAPTVSAPKGSLYLRTDGSTTNDRMYVNTNASTTWTAVTTVA